MGDAACKFIARKRDLYKYMYSVYVAIKFTYKQMSHTDTQVEFKQASGVVVWQLVLCVTMISKSVKQKHNGFNIS